MSQPTLLARLKARYETDIADSELQRLIDEANQEVIRRWGPHADAGDPDADPPRAPAPITVQDQGGGKTISLARPVDLNHLDSVVVTEFWRSVPFGDPQETVLTTSDYRIWFEGRTIERVYTGPNNFGRTWGRDPAPEDRFGWGGSAGWVTITYVPANDGNQREEVILQLCILGLEHRPELRSQVGNVLRFDLNYTAEREKLLGSLAPAGGLMFR